MNESIPRMVECNLRPNPSTSAGVRVAYRAGTGSRSSRMSSPKLERSAAQTRIRVSVSALVTMGGVEGQDPRKLLQYLD